MSNHPWLKLKVARKWVEATDIAAFELVDEAGAILPAFEAGAHVDILVPGGLIRSYSLCNSPTERRRYVVAVLCERDGRGGSLALHQQVKQGDSILVGAPKNEFSLVSPAVYSVLIGGGVGVAPLLAMAEALWRKGAGFQLFYIARNRERAAFAKALRISPHGSRVHFHWTEQQGRPDFTQVLRSMPSSSQLYVCGPDGLISNVVAAAAKLSWRPEQVHFEHFYPAQR